MPVFRLTRDSIEPLRSTSFARHGLKERTDLQRLLRAHIETVADDVLVIAEEFGDWDDSRRRIDLLAVDRNANLVVIELKRGVKGGHMDLQAIRYAAMVSSMTFDRAVEVFQAYLDGIGSDQDAETRLLEFLEWDEPDEDEFGRDTRIILVAADFSKELTTSVLWLNERDLDIRCVRVAPYQMGSEIVVDVQQVVPLPEAEEHQVRVREKAISRRESARRGAERTGFWFVNSGEDRKQERRWEDCRKYGFMVAGGGARWIRAICKLKVGDRLFAYVRGHGYTGLGEVVAEAVPQKDFVPPGQAKPLVDLPLLGEIDRDRMNNPERCDWCVGVRWIQAVDREDAVLKSGARRGTVVMIREAELVEKLLARFGESGASE